MIRSRGGWARWFVPALLLLLTIKTTWGVLGTFDIGFDDETIYLEAAHWAGKRFLPLADSSPLYPLWYRGLSFFEPDPVRLYFLNWLVLTTSLPLLLYALARRSGAPLAAAAIVAVAWSMSNTVMTWPFVSKFAALVLGLGALGATMFRDRRVAAAVTAVALALTAYARAELTVPSFAFAGIVALWSLWSLVETFRGPTTGARRTRRLRSLLAFALSIAAPLGLRRFFGDPHQGGRAFFAFGQHYALNVVEAKHLVVDPWPIWDRFVREAFPHATTISEAVKENPAAFFWHVRRNVDRLPDVLSELLAALPHVPEAIARVVRAGVTIVVLGGLLALLLALLSRRRLLDRRFVAWFPLAAVIAITTLGSTLLVYPRAHYLLPMACLGLAALAAGCARLRRPAWLRPRWWIGLPRALRPRAWHGPATVTALVLLLAALPSRRGTMPSLLPSREPAPSLVHENLQTIEVLRSLDLRGTVPILEPDHSRGLYANLDFVRVAQWDKTGTFWQLVHDRQVAVVVLNWRLREDPRFKLDPEFTAFADGTGEREDFQFIPVPETSAVLAVRKSVLERAR